MVKCKQTAPDANKNMRRGLFVAWGAVSLSGLYTVRLLDYRHASRWRHSTSPAPGLRDQESGSLARRPSEMY